MKDTVEILLDEEDFSNVILYDDEGCEMEFEQLGMVPLNDELYFILAPVNVKGMSDGEVVILKYVEFNGQDDLQLLDDENVGNQVIEKYYELLK